MRSLSSTIHRMLLLVVPLAGCAVLNWQKPGGDPAQAAKDLDECQLKSTLSARRAGGMGSQAPVIVGTPSGPVTVMPPAFNAASDPVALQSILSDCMRARGYHLQREGR